MCDAHFGVIANKLCVFLRDFRQILEGSLLPFVTFLREPLPKGVANTWLFGEIKEGHRDENDGRTDGQVWTIQNIKQYFQLFRAQGMQECVHKEGADDDDGSGQPCVLKNDRSGCAVLAGNCEYLPAQLMGRRYTDVGEAIEVVQELKRAQANVPGLVKENKDLTKDGERGFMAHFQAKRCEEWKAATATANTELQAFGGICGPRMVATSAAFAKEVSPPSQSALLLLISRPIMHASGTKTPTDLLPARKCRLLRAGMHFRRSFP